jgi:hypothetical protein
MTDDIFHIFGFFGHGLHPCKYHFRVAHCWRREGLTVRNVWKWLTFALVTLLTFSTLQIGTNP